MNENKQVGNKEIVLCRRPKELEDISKKINDYVAFEKKALTLISQTSDPEKVPDIQSALMRLLNLDDPYLLLDWDWTTARADEVVMAIQPYLDPPSTRNCMTFKFYRTRKMGTVLSRDLKEARSVLGDCRSSSYAR